MKTNHRKATETLLKRECRRQTVHLVLSGAYRVSHINISECFDLVNRRCPSLLQYLTTPGTRLERLQDADVDSQAIESEDKHLDAAAQIRVLPKSVRLLDDVLLSVRTLHNLRTKHPFPKLLCMVYNTDYNMPNIVSFDAQVLQWAKRIRFTDPYVLHSCFPHLRMF
jgi:hypothetical protein